MKRRLPTDLGRAVFRFFQEYLPTQRGVSVHTLRSYRDSVTRDSYNSPSATVINPPL